MKISAAKKHPVESQNPVDTEPTFWDCRVTHGINNNNTMRTKALLLAAATGLATLVATNAQVVYSVNVVGYINVDLADGYTMIANQLDNGNGNLIVDVLGDQVNEGTFVYKWNGSGYDILNFDFGEWTGVTTATMAPGEGVFVRSIGTATVTMVGEVVEGANDVALDAGFNIISSVAPVATDLADAGNTWPGADGDFFYLYDQALNGGQGGYNIVSYDFGEFDGPMVLQVGQAAWVRKAAATTWTRNFSVDRTQ